MTTASRFIMPLGEAMFSLRAIRRFKPDPIPDADVRDIIQAPVIVLVCATAKGAGAMGSVIPAVQNMLLAARSLGIGGTITTLHPKVLERVHQLLVIPDSVQVVYCVPLGYPRGAFGPVIRKPLAEVCSLDRWDGPAI